MKASFVIAFALALGACTTEPTPQVPTAAQPATPAPGASASAPVEESNYDKALRFTRCMNAALDAAYPDVSGAGRRVPDPVEGEPLQTYVAVPPEAYKGQQISAAVGTADGKWAVVVPEIFEQCKHHLPAIWPVKADPDDLARFGAFYDCLRKRGIDVPQPDANGVIHANPDPERFESPEYKAGEEACRHLADDPAVKAGQR